MLPGKAPSQNGRRRSGSRRSDSWIHVEFSPVNAIRFVYPTCCLVTALVAGCSNEGGIVSLPPGCAESEAASAGAIAAIVAAGSPVSAEDLIDAMGMEAAAAPAPSLSGEADQAAVFPGLGVVEPTQGSMFAWLSTGVAGAGTTSAVGASAGTLYGTDFGNVLCAGDGTYDCVELRFSFVVPPDHHAVRFDFRFFTTEYPEFLGWQFNDSFTVSLSSPSYEFPNISFDEEGREINVNSQFFQSFEVVECEDLAGTGFDVDWPGSPGACHGGATSLLGTIAPVAPGETVTLTFELHDEGDGDYDSAVMIDHLETTPASVDSPETNDCD